MTSRLIQLGKRGKNARRGQKTKDVDARMNARPYRKGAVVLTPVSDIGQVRIGAPAGRRAYTRSYSYYPEIGMRDIQRLISVMPY